jgi:hypothetical protein
MNKQQTKIKCDLQDISTSPVGLMVVSFGSLLSIWAVASDGGRPNVRLYHGKCEHQTVNLR